jgi:hypothetical protein
MSDTEVERIAKDAELAAKIKTVDDAAKVLEEAIKASAPESANRSHALALLGDTLSCAHWAIVHYK